jgi:hypothetical protein
LISSADCIIIEITMKTTLIEPRSDLSSYEDRALREIREFKSSLSDRRGPAAGWMDWPAEGASKWLTRVPGARRIMNSTVGRVVGLLSDLGHWTLRPDAVYADYRKLGFDVAGPLDAAALELAVVDRAARGLKAKYQSLAAAEGAAAGMIGAAGIPADVTAVVALNQRAVSEYAAYYGFNLADPEERVFAMNVLGLAAGVGDPADRLNVNYFFRAAKGAMSALSPKTAGRNVAAGLAARMAEKIGLRLTRVKMIQFAPLVGAGLGAGLNAQYTGRVCDAAYHLYRERFLARKYDRDADKETQFMVRLNPNPEEDER